MKKKIQKTGGKTLQKRELYLYLHHEYSLKDNIKDYIHIDD